MTVICLGIGYNPRNVRVRIRFFFSPAEGARHRRAGRCRRRRRGAGGSAHSGTNAAGRGAAGVRRRRLRNRRAGFGIAHAAASGRRRGRVALRPRRVALRGGRRRPGRVRPVRLVADGGRGGLFAGTGAVAVGRPRNRRAGAEHFAFAKSRPSRRAGRPGGVARQRRKHARGARRLFGSRPFDSGTRRGRPELAVGKPRFAVGLLRRTNSPRRIRRRTLRRRWRDGWSFRSAPTVSPTATRCRATGLSPASIRRSRRCRRCITRIFSSARGSIRRRKRNSIKPKRSRRTC